MDLIKFWFFVMPGVFLFIGVVFGLIFGADILRWYLTRRAAERAAQQPPTERDVVEPVEYGRPEPAAWRNSKKVLVSK